jgi:hypothetical protein
MARLYDEIVKHPRYEVVPSATVARTYSHRRPCASCLTLDPKMPFWMRQPSTRGIRHGLFGKDDLMASSCKARPFTAHDSRPRFERLEHVRTNTFNRQKPD